MNIFRSLLFFLILLPQLGLAQNYATKKDVSKKCYKRYQKAKQYNQQGNYPAAIKELKKALKEKPVFIDALILKASLEGVQGNNEQAILDFEQVLSIDSGYSPQVYYELAFIEKQQKKYDSAIHHLEQYLAIKPKSEKRKKRAKRALRNLIFIAEAVKNPVPFEPESLGSLINTPGPEYLPTLRADGEELVYTVRRDHQEDFFISHSKDGVWQKGVAIDDINTPWNEGAQSLSSDGRLLVFTACQYPDSKGSCDLYFSVLKNGKWTQPQGIENINTKAFEGQPSLSADGNYLYFTSNRPGGMGGKDIWVSKRTAKGGWAPPQNLKSPINTPETDECPFIHADGQTLYFCSDGHPGMGKEDLFFAKKNNDQTWSTPQNLGYPINTEANEATLVISTDGQTAYYATDNPKYVPQKGQFLNFDILSFSLYDAARPNPVTYVKGRVTDANSDRGIYAQLEVVNLSNEQVLTIATTDRKGHFLFCLPAGKEYALHINSDRYLFHSSHFSLQEENDYNHPYLLDVALEKIPETSSDVSTSTQPIVLENIFFKTGSAELEQSSFVELNRLYTLLAQNHALKIRINGHTDNVGKKEDNRVLSSERAKAVYDFLIKKGISADRLSYHGYGENRPIADNNTTEGRKKNRRTEFEVVGD